MKMTLKRAHGWAMALFVAGMLGFFMLTIGSVGELIATNQLIWMLTAVISAYLTYICVRCFIVYLDEVF